MKLLLAPLLLALLSLPAFAALNMKPGLWEMEMQMGGGDGQPDPMAQMREAMAGMSPEQQKQMMAMMGKMRGGAGLGVNDKGGITTKVCYTKEMLENEASLAQQKDKKCTTNIKEKTAKKVVLDFKCEDGTMGDGVWTIEEPTKFLGLMNVTDKKGQKNKMTFKGKFASNDCGTVKPFNSSAQTPAATGSGTSGAPGMPANIKIPTH